MRWHILRTLLYKEYLRHLANRGGIVMLLLLVVIALLLSLWRPTSQGPLLGGEVQRCYLNYWTDDPAYAEHIRPWIAYLAARKRPEWGDSFRIQSAQKMAVDANGKILFNPNVGSIQVRSKGYPFADGRPSFEVQMWYPGADDRVLAGFEAWFWKESGQYFQQALGDKAPLFAEERTSNTGSADVRSALAVVPLFFALFFTCVYLLPSMTCEERERGVLLAQALSPASPLEILISKFLFYAVLGIGMSALLGGIYRPGLLAVPYFWFAITVASFGSLCVGLTIASIAGTQRLASMGAMCYLLMVALFLFTLQQINLPFVPYLFLEYHIPQMLHAVMVDAVRFWPWDRSEGKPFEPWLHLGAATFVAGGWAWVATRLFRQRGWQ